MRRIILVTVLASLLFSFACSSQSHEEFKEAQDLNPKLNLTSYIEDGKLMTIVVNTKVARIRHEEGYMPLELALANKGLAGVTLTKESFRLVDSEGRSYPAVGADELKRNYKKLTVDRRVGDLISFARGRFQTYEQISSNWTPTFDNGVERPELHLSRNTWAYDYLYFPRPETGVRGQRFELHVDSPELPHPILLKFKVRS